MAGTLPFDVGGRKVSGAVWWRMRDRDGNISIKDTLSPVTSFKYLEIILLASHNVWPVVVQNLWPERHKWERISRVLSR